ncbi:MAG: V-type ATP synthase subunit F [Promethearchaeota archaeon]
MTIICVADEDTNIMFGLLGIEGYLLPENDQNKFVREFDKLLHNDEIQLIFMPEKYLVKYKNYFQQIKIQRHPIIVEIPDIKASFNADYFNHHIKQMVGLSQGD